MSCVGWSNEEESPRRQRLMVLVLLMLALFVVTFVVAAETGGDIVLAVAAMGALVTGHALRRELRERLVYRRGDDDAHAGRSSPADGDRDVGPL